MIKREKVLTILCLILWPLIIPIGFWFVCLVAMPTVAYMMVREFHEKLAAERRHERGDFSGV